MLKITCFTVLSLFYLNIHNSLAHENKGKLDASLDQVLVGSIRQITFTYTLGAEEIAAGGGLRIEIPRAYAETEFLFWSRPQTEEPDLAGYVTGKTSTGAVVKLETYGILGGIFQCTLDNGKLAAGDKIELSYMGQVQSLARIFTIRAQVRTGADQPWHDIVNVAQIQLVPQKAQTLLLTAPADIVAGQPFDFVVRVLDKFGNLASGFRGKIDMSATDPHAELPRSYQFTEQDSGRHIFKNALFNSSGFHKINITDSDKMKISGHYSYVAETEKKYKRYFGDTHFHTGSGSRNRGFILSRSDPRAEAVKRPNSPGDHRANFTTAVEAYRYAREVSGLDFASASEHDSYFFDEQAWQLLQGISEKFYNPGKFTTFFAYEWTQNIMHHIVLYKDKGNKVFDRDECTDLPSLWSALDKQGRDALTIPHLTWDFDNHSNWDHINNDYRRLGEIYSLWNSRYLIQPADEPQRFELGKENKWSFQYGWQKGHKIGVIGSSDNHLGQPGANNYTIYTQHAGGLAVALSEHNNRDALWDTFLDRRTYATTGTRIYLDFTVNGYYMGSEITAHEAPLIKAKIAGTNTLQQVEVIKYAKGNYETIYSFSEVAETAEFEFKDENFDGDCFYYLRVSQVDEIPGRLWAFPTREMAWSSPVWVTLQK